MARKKSNKNKGAKKQKAASNQQKNQQNANASPQDKMADAKPAPKKSAAKKSNKAKSGQSKPAMSRRNLLLLLGATPVAIAGGYKIHQHDVTSKTLHNLSIIAQGQPVVFQVHEPSCQLCRRLKRSTESALDTMPEIAYRIADLTSAEGREIAQRYGVGKVTLLLFDADGKHVHTVQGVTPKDELITRFERYLTSATPS